MARFPRRRKRLLRGEIVALEGHRRISASGRCSPTRCRGAPAPAQASRREAFRADDAVTRRWRCEYCEMSAAEVELLESQAAPIVLLQPKPGTDIAWNVAHCSPYLGVMLPYSPLHHLLMKQCPFPLIATSGNRSDEPIAIANDEASARLKDIADHFLMHNRPIVRACDDSVVRLTRGRAGILRRARGYAPLGIRVARDLPPVLAVGGHLKNTVAIAVGHDVFLSQHIGDLETLEARQAFEKAIARSVPALQLQAGSCGLRSASRLRFHPLGREIRAARDSRAASSGPCGCVCGGE